MESIGRSPRKAHTHNTRTHLTHTHTDFSPQRRQHPIATGLHKAPPSLAQAESPGNCFFFHFPNFRLPGHGGDGVRRLPGSEQRYQQDLPPLFYLANCNSVFRILESNTSPGSPCSVAPFPRAPNTMPALPDHHEAPHLPSWPDAPPRGPAQLELTDPWL